MAAKSYGGTGGRFPSGRGAGFIILGDLGLGLTSVGLARAENLRLGAAVIGAVDLWPDGRSFKTLPARDSTQI